MNLLRTRAIPTVVALACALLLCEGASFAQGTAGSAAFGPVDLTVQVDRTLCAASPGLCQSADVYHTSAAAGPDNHNPVMLGLQVLDDGDPVAGLLKTAFTISSIQVVPAGGPFLKVIDCPSCFGGPLLGDGIYFILVDPIPLGMNWKSGTYLVQVRVTHSGKKGQMITKRALARIDIPWAESQLITQCQVITRPGSYIVGTNLPGSGGLLAANPGLGVNAGDCLVVNTGDVTVNLNGFMLQGSTALGSAGVRNTGLGGNVRVHDGTITGFEVGVDLNVVTARGNSVERVRAVNNTKVGIRGGSNGRIVGNIARGNGLEGIAFNCPTVIQGNIATDNGAGPPNDLVFIGGGGSGDSTTCRLTDNVITSGPSGFNNHH